MFYLPSEWFKHRGTITTYPHSEENFFEELEEVREQFINFISYISEGEKVYINVNSEDDRIDLEKKLNKRNIKNIVIFINPTNDVWCRDNCPIFVKDKNNKTVALKFKFNGWGEKYPYELDDRAGRKITEFLGVERIDIDIVLEGGAIETNGEGYLLTTEACLLNKNRNPDLSKEELENYLKFYFGVKNIIWLKRGLIGDDTDGHIDNITRFVSSNIILTAMDYDKNTENYQILKENLEILKNLNIFHIEEIPLPSPLYYRYPGDEEESLLPANYMNFYITNRYVIVPIFNQDTDNFVLNKIQKFFKDRKVVGLPADKILIGKGAFHCLTQQVI